MAGTGKFTQTSSEIKAYTGFYVAPGNQYSNRENVKFLVLRYDDERSSELCKAIEEMSLSNGGIIIEDESAIKRGFSKNYRTGLFHSNCRCRLIVRPEPLSDITDSIDFQMAVGDTSLREAAVSQAKEKLSEEFIADYMSHGYQKRVQMVYDVNLSGEHYRHDRREQTKRRRLRRQSSRR